MSPAWGCPFSSWPPPATRAGATRWPAAWSLARRRAAAAVPALLLAPYFLAVLYGDWVMVSQGRLRIDLRQMRELRAVLDARVDPAERILCLSHWHSCRLYYMSRRPPCTPY